MPASTFGFQPNPIGITGSSINNTTFTYSIGSTVFALISYNLISNNGAAAMSVNGVTCFYVNVAGTNNLSVADTFCLPPSSTIIISASSTGYASFCSQLFAR